MKNFDLFRIIIVSLFVINFVAAATQQNFSATLGWFSAAVLSIAYIEK